jgi:hypothetical protein
MSVVAGCSLMNGILMGADCRLTYREKDGKETYRDTLQKLIQLTPTTVLGFAGDVSTASQILKPMIGLKPHRIDGFSLRHWLPRFCQYQFAKYANARYVEFMVGSVIPSRPNIVERAAAIRIVFNAINARGTGSGNFVSPQLKQFLLGGDSKYVILPNEPEGLLYVMRSPQFEPVAIKPVEYCAIGSGEGITGQTTTLGDMIFSAADGIQKESDGDQSCDGAFPPDEGHRECRRHVYSDEDRGSGSVPDLPEDGAYTQRTVLRAHVRKWPLGAAEHDDR